MRRSAGSSGTRSTSPSTNCRISRASPARPSCFETRTIRTRRRTCATRATSTTRGAHPQAAAPVRAVRGGVRRSRRSASDRRALPREARRTVADYARFRAAVERQRRPFQQWPARMRDAHRRHGLRRVELSLPRLLSDARRASRWQRSSEQARASGVGLYMDLPLGAHSSRLRRVPIRGRAAARLRDRRAARTRCSRVGKTGASRRRTRRARAPPAHAYFIAALRHQMRFASVLRIDHVHGAASALLYSEGARRRPKASTSARPEGSCTRRSASSRTAPARYVVGEDLGTVPDEVRARMARHGVGRLFVLQYEDVPELGRVVLGAADGAVASLNTHDMPTFCRLSERYEIWRRAASSDSSTATDARARAR